MLQMIKNDQGIIVDAKDYPISVYKGIFQVILTHSHYLLTILQDLLSLFLSHNKKEQIRVGDLMMGLGSVAGAVGQYPQATFFGAECQEQYYQVIFFFYNIFFTL